MGAAVITADASGRGRRRRPVVPAAKTIQVFPKRARVALAPSGAGPTVTATVRLVDGGLPPPTSTETGTASTVQRLQRLPVMGRSTAAPDGA